MAEVISSLTAQILVSVHILEGEELWHDGDTDKQRDREKGLPMVSLTEWEEAVMKPEGNQQLSKAAGDLKIRA